MNPKINPKQLFTTNTVSREQIAEDLNITLEAASYQAQSIVDDRLAPDDERLTDEICRTYAEGIGNIDTDMPNDAQEDEEAELCERILKAIGIDLDALDVG